MYGLKALELLSLIRVSFSAAALFKAITLWRTQQTFTAPLLYAGHQGTHPSEAVTMFLP